MMTLEILVQIWHLQPIKKLKEGMEHIQLPHFSGSYSFVRVFSFLCSIEVAVSCGDMECSMILLCITLTHEIGTRPTRTHNTHSLYIFCIMLHVN